MPDNVADIVPDADAAQLLDALQTGAALCSRDCRLLFVNRAAREILSQAGLADKGETCRKIFFAGENDEFDCRGPDLCARGGQHSLTIRGDRGEVYLKLSCQSWQGAHLLTIHDLTREITLLRQSDLDRKELHAKNILLERRRRLYAEEQAFLTQLMNNLPDALLTVDDGYRIQRRNRGAEEMFAAQQEAASCYALLGRKQPCPECPAKKGFAAADGEKKSHEAGGRVYTEIFSVAPNGAGGLLIFRDITRQVTLINQIRSHQQEIALKNGILSLLAEFGTYLQKEHDVKEVVDHFLDVILPSLHPGPAVIIVNDIRIGNLWIAEERGVEAEAFKTLTRACLGRDLQALKSGGLIAAASLPWPRSSQMVLAGAKGQRVGMVVLQGSLGDEALGFLRLVTEMLGSYFQNQLLLRQLEEKANRDSLTGLFNRGYLTQAMEEERLKFSRYGVHYAVVLIDINQLKKLNDEHGHDRGDQLIVLTAESLAQGLRSTDMAARTGGDEFVVLLSDSTDHDAGHFVQRLQEEIFVGLSVPLASGGVFPLTVSIGRAATDRFPPEALLKEADQQMYASKREFYQKVERYR
jgi:diguanylate cyclase (GGDEF)-like protein